MPAATGDASAKEMLKRLGLDDPELTKDRASTLALLDSGDLDVEDFWNTATDEVENLAHVAYQHCGRILP